MGVMVIAIGLLFFLDNLDIIDVHDALAFWPMVFIFAGVAKLLDTSSPNGYLVGLAGIGIGTAMILQRLGLIYVSWRSAWPLVLIGMGGVLVYRAVTGPRNPTHGVIDDKAGEIAQTVDVTAVLGGFDRRVHTPDFRGGEVTAVMGGCALDLRQASMTGEAIINVFAFWGGVTLKVPPDWTVILHGTPIMGGFDEKTVRPPDNSKRLIVRGYAIMGGVEVRN
ncbi:cell wall-active antibiotics response protein [Massilia sp. Dwa41.01b]|nr:cell wall-active antibiotics response protein [Massilia sp. Dwa41.01b]QNB01420.1 cell wall-active antibiotics response protein [Massilia sp. Se16.2.3]